MSAVSTETPDTLVNKPGYKVPEKSKAIYTSDDEDDHQSYAEYSDTDEDASESEEEIEFHEATEPLYNPNMRNYEDEHGFTVNVRTDDEYSDDTTDSEYIEEKKRQSQMIAPEAMHHLANQETDSESEYEDKIGAVYKSEVSQNFSDHSKQEHTSYRQSIESMSATGSNHSESEIGQNTTAAFATKSNNRNSFTIRPRSHKITPLESLQSSDNSDSDGEDEYEHQSLPKNRPKSNLRNSVSVRPNSHRPAARESFQSTDASISENEQANDFVSMDLSERPKSQRPAVRNSFQSTDASISDNEQRDTFVPMASSERPKSNIRHSTSVRRSSQRIITPIDAQLVQDLSSYLEPKKQITVEESDNSRDTEKYVAEAQETHLKNAPMNKRNSISSSHSNEDDAEHGFDPTGYGMDLHDDVENHSHRSSYLSDREIVHKENDIVHKYSEDKIPETSSSHSVEGVQSTSVSDFESDASADTALTTPKTEIEPLDDIKKTAMTFTAHQNLADEPVQTTSPKDYVDYLEELEQTPELPPKDSMSKVSAAARSNRFSIQSLSELKEISLDQPSQPAPPAKDFPSTSQDQGYTLPSYNRNNRHSKTLPPIDTSMGTGRQSTSSEQSSPRSGILSNAFRLQTPVTFSNPFKRSPPSSTVTTPRTSISTIHTRPSQAYSARQSKRMSKQLGLASPVVGGSVDEMLLARLEQQNTELRKDPKNRVLQNLQREAVRRSVENLKQDKANKGVDGEGDYDWEFWALCLSNFQHITRSQSRVLATNIQRGIPPSLRGMIWQMFSKSKDPVLESQYRDFLRRDSPYDKMIQRDLARTFPDHQFFKDPDGQGQVGLYNVVKAYSIYDEEVGYCQGIAFIVGALLLNMPDEEAFCVLTCLMKQYGLRGHYTPDMDGLQLHLYQYERILAEQLPHIDRHLERKGITSTMYASQWFMTLFAYRFPLEVVFRIYDIMLSEGVESIIRFAIALLKKNEKTILSLDFEALLSYLKNDLFSDYETQQLVEDACAVNITARRIDQLTKEYRNTVVKAQMEKEAVEDLQRSNADISATIQDLEQRLSKMFQEHDDVLAQLDESKKQMRQLTSENEKMRSHVASLKETVELLPQEVEALSRDEFEVLCTENATLIEKNCSLEDQLNAAESLLIDMKIKYAESENETDSLRRHLNEMRKIMAV